MSRSRERNFSRQKRGICQTLLSIRMIRVNLTDSDQNINQLIIFYRNVINLQRFGGIFAKYYVTFRAFNYN